MMRCIILLAVAAVGSLLAVEIIPYDGSRYNGEWQVLPETEYEVAGLQRLWFVAPIGIRRGRLSGSIKILEVGENYFTAMPKCGWGNMVYRFVRTDAAAISREIGFESKRIRGLEDIDFADLVDHIDRNLLVDVLVRGVEEIGSLYDVVVNFRKEAIPFRLSFDQISYKRGKVLPDVRNIRYGPHAKHRIDLYYPEERGDELLPLIVKIHGGGWGAGNKVSATGVEACIESGFAFASISYRYVSEYDEAPAAILPPVSAPFYDAARAIQLLRFRAGELGLDKTRFGFTGGSAGGATCLWLAFHDDLADPTSDDPISRESTKPQAILVVQPQSSLDPQQMRAWIPSIQYGSHALLTRESLSGNDQDRNFSLWLEKRDEILPWIQEYSPIEHISADDPPVLLAGDGRTQELPAIDDGHATHHPIFCEMVDRRLAEVDVPSYFRAQNVRPEVEQYRRGQQFWIDYLKNLGDGAPCLEISKKTPVPHE